MILGLRCNPKGYAFTVLAGNAYKLTMADGAFL